MRSKQGIRVLFLAVLAYAAAPSYSSAQSNRADSIADVFLHHPDQVMVTAHRGAHTFFPENSLEAITAAVKDGADVLELDARQTSDGQLVVMHDKSIDRTSTGKGDISAHTSQELKAYRLTFEGKPTDEHIPDFREALMAARGQIMVDIDFKINDVQAAKNCYALVHELGMEKQVLFFVYDHRLAPKLLDYDSTIMVMPRAHNVQEVREILADKRVKVIHIDPGFYADAAKMIRDAGVRVWANALGEYDGAAEKEQGDYSAFFRDLPLVNVIQTNHPGLLKNYLMRR